MRRNTTVTNGGDFNPESERRRLVSLCRRWTGESSVAEDLAQEAVLVGLRRQKCGQPPREWQTFLTGVARRLCLHYRSRRYREEEHLAPEMILENLPDIPADPLDDLIRTEREELVERALGKLKEPVRQLLIARYMEEIPLTEMAERLQLSENALTVRVHRGREALRKVWETVLRDEAAAHGLLDNRAAEGWRTTPLYCVRCGKERLVGQFQQGDPATGTPFSFALDCPTCQGSLVGMTSQVLPMDARAVLVGVQGFRAGLNRVNRWWQGYIADALLNRNAACIRCGNSAVADISADPAHPGLYIACKHCRAITFYIHPTGLLYHSDAAQRFWRRYPRMQNGNPRAIICEGRPALLTTFADRVTSARIEMVFDRESLQPLRTEILAG